MNDKQIVISSYFDLSRLSPDIRYIHFRKFVSKRLLEKVLKSCPKVKKISLSKYAASRLNYNLSSYRVKRSLPIEISGKNPGRPNFIEIKRRWGK